MNRAIHIASIFGAVLAACLVAGASVAAAEEEKPRFHVQGSFTITIPGPKGITIERFGGETVTCEQAKSPAQEGSIKKGSKLATGFLLKLEKCENGKSEKCKNVAGKEEISTERLEGKLGYLLGAENKANATEVAFAIKTEGAPAPKIASFECGGTAGYELSGNKCMVGTLKVAENKEEKEYTLKVPRSGSGQEITEYEPELAKGINKECKGLELKVPGEMLEEIRVAGLGMSGTLKAECPGMQKIED